MDSAWFTNYFCPIAGLVITNYMWLSPLPTVLKMRSSKQTQSVNPTPFTFMFLNCIGWVIYALMVDNVYVFFANASGVLFGLYYILSVMMSLITAGVSKDETVPQLYYQLERHLICALALWILLSIVSTSSILQRIWHVDETKRHRVVIGNAVMVCNVAYYAAPFSSLLKIIQSKDSSSILAVLVFANLLDASLWLVYACAIDDWYLMIPNGLGVMMALSQLFVRLIYCRRGPTYQELSTSTAVLVEELTPSVELPSQEEIRTAA